MRKRGREKGEGGRGEGGGRGEEVRGRWKGREVCTGMMEGETVVGTHIND